MADDHWEVPDKPAATTGAEIPFLALGCSGLHFGLPALSFVHDRSVFGLPRERQSSGPPLAGRTDIAKRNIPNQTV